MAHEVAGADDRMLAVAVVTGRAVCGGVLLLVRGAMSALHAAGIEAGAGVVRGAMDRVARDVDALLRDGE